MSTFEPSIMLARFAWFLGAGAVAIGVLRCAPSPGACVRVSDCASGLTCVEGSCVSSSAPAPETDATASGRADGSSDASVASTADGTASDTGTEGDAPAEAEADPDASADGDADGGDQLPPEE